MGDATALRWINHGDGDGGEPVRSPSGRLEGSPVEQERVRMVGDAPLGGSAGKWQPDSERAPIQGDTIDTPARDGDGTRVLNGHGSKTEVVPRCGCIGKIGQV